MAENTVIDAMLPQEGTSNQLASTNFNNNNTQYFDNSLNNRQNRPHYNNKRTNYNNNNNLNPNGYKKNNRYMNNQSQLQQQQHQQPFGQNRQNQNNRNNNNNYDNNYDFNDQVSFSNNNSNYNDSNSSYIRNESNNNQTNRFSNNQSNRHPNSGFKANMRNRYKSHNNNSNSYYGNNINSNDNHNSFDQVDNNSSTPNPINNPSKNMDRYRNEDRRHNKRSQINKNTSKNSLTSDLPSTSSPNVNSSSNSATSKKKHSSQQTKQQEQTRSEILIEQLKKNKCECMVCYQNIRNDNPIWSCNVCFHIFHLKCIKKWANSPSAKIDENQEDWRCPGCQTTFEHVPTKYTCFCGKKINPDPTKDDSLNSNKPIYLKQNHVLPHSCGDICSRLLQHSAKFWLSNFNAAKSEQSTESIFECKHKCVQTCHPGPCNPCESIVMRTCNCGKSKFQVKCSSNKAPLCEAKCDKKLNCMMHECSQICHSGECETCDIDIEQNCYSHNTKRVIKCGSSNFSKQEKESIMFKCQEKCNKKLDCGNHNCEELCHEGSCKPCQLMPSKLTHCPCGKVQLRELIIKNKIIRTSCLDPVPTCENKCGRILHDMYDDNEEVHMCESKCHQGKCGECKKTVEVKCRCGKESDFIECYKRKDLKLCKRRCQKKKSCGRHQCNETCCNDIDHICIQVCNRMLNCGLHKCEELCHKNQCPRCLVASFQERICDCGHTVQYPPIRCGTAPLECKQKCAREHDCNHPISHNCHWEEKCPNCPYLSSKMCMGNHELRHNIPCYMKDVSCGKPCDKQLPNCSHKCIRTCHKNDCIDTNESSNNEETIAVCTQPCQKERPHCTHICGSPCHGNQPCPDTVCQATVIVKCKCGLKTKQIKCLQRMNETSQVVFENLACEIKEMLSCRSIDVSTFKNTQVLKKKHELPCDDECLIAERNKNIASALQIDTTLRPKPIYSDLLKNYAREEPAFVSDLEKRLEAIVKECKLMTKPTKKWFTLPIMKSYERKIIHEIAPYYGLETQSVDPEPYRNVCVIGTKDKCFLPSITLTQSCELKTKQQSTMPRLTNMKQLNQLTSSSNPIQSNFKKLNNYSSTDSNTNAEFFPLTSAYSVLADEDSDTEIKKELKITSSTDKTDKIIDYFDLTE